MKSFFKSAFASKPKVAIQDILGEAIERGFFDKAWYEQTYGLRFENEAKAFEDYVRRSRFAPVNPSPNFDSESYHRTYQDVYHAQISPLRHFLEKGQFEARHTTPANPRWTPNQIEQFEMILTPEAEVLNVAVCLHIFYEDFVDRFAKALKHFPVQIDLFVTAVDKKTEAIARKVFSRHPKVKSVRTSIVPNRGRNFGPMLVEYAEELLRYDFMVHLHSKKSLYSGKEQTQWADYLIEYLLRDTVVLTQMLNAFAADKTLGVYYPTTFWLMPTWVNHMTMNKGYVKEWQDKLKLGDLSDFLAYPAGGMFAARPSAIGQILSEKYNYEDFPAEPLPNDGSFLHALERIIGALAEKNGFKQLFYYSPSGVFTKDQSYITSTYKGAPIWEQMATVRNHECISFDVFDTLVRRKYTAPDYAKIKLGKDLVAEGLVKTPLEFVEVRNNAELNLRKRNKFQGDVIINDIYIEIAKVLGISQSKAMAYMNQEFEYDLEMILPKNEMVSFFNELGHLGHKLWVISDTYYTKQQVALMMRKAGVVGAYRLVVSSEAQKRKDNGTMWVMIKADLEAEGISKHLHIGDNVVADAQRPGDLGLTTFHILHPMDKWEALGFPKVLSGKGALDETEILKWGGLISDVGRNPFIGR
ncbi:rhamnan synthesis F family protein [Pseudoalteromonas marina]|uniref:rhamnan synthesis F family protein n=1 Tax=Pseudoalteromonas marina TaxID=267375 RepID=UPI0023F2582D|nr:rhamnan synthesis F family protein [Pseudoalteromonas marina]